MSNKRKPSVPDTRPSSSNYDAFVRAHCASLGADAFVVVVVGGELGTGACPALRAGPQARVIAQALRIAFLEMADRILIEGERAAGRPTS